MWKWPDALHLVRTLQPAALQGGYCLSVGGGVINCGTSFNNLDLIATPHMELTHSEEGLLNCLSTVLTKVEVVIRQYGVIHRFHTPDDHKVVNIYLFDEKPRTP